MKEKTQKEKKSLKVWRLHRENEKQTDWDIREGEKWGRVKEFMGYFMTHKGFGEKKNKNKK